MHIQIYIYMQRPQSPLNSNHPELIQDAGTQDVFY